jgi:hypothetical protein
MWHPPGDKHPRDPGLAGRARAAGLKRTIGGPLLSPAPSWVSAVTLKMEFAFEL